MFVSALSSVAVATEIIAHRGASHEAPENTLAALRLGFEQGAEAGELDVHLTADGRLVVIHDADTRRVAGIDLPVAAQTAAVLQALEAGQWGRWKGSTFAEKIPLLSDALALVPAGRRQFIELKVGAAGVPELVRVVRASGLSARQLPIITFSFETAHAAKQALPEHEVCWLVDYPADPQKNPPPALGDLIARVKAAGLDGLDLDKDFPIDAAFVAQVRAAGLKLYTWTVDDPGRAAELRAAGVDGITTNRPAWLRAQLAEMKKP